MTRAVETEDGKIVYEGDRVFNYYDMKWGTIRPGSLGPDGWFTVVHEDGSMATLNGQRIATYDPRGK